MQELTQEDILKDREMKSEILRRLYQGFQNEMKEIEEQQQKILLDMIRFKQSHE